VVEAVITVDIPDPLKRQGSTEKILIEVHPLDFPFKIWILNWRSRLTEAMGIPRIGWKEEVKGGKTSPGERKKETYT
jgi:hypothetical protein